MADWQRAMDLRITAVPARLCGGKLLSGFGAYDDFVLLIGESRHALARNNEDGQSAPF